MHSPSPAPAHDQSPAAGTPIDLEDVALVQGLLCDDARSWRTFNDRYSRLIYRCITRVTTRFRSVVSADDVREIYSMLIVQLLNHDKHKLRQFDPHRGARLSTFVGMLATHASYDFLRARRREPRLDDVREADTIPSSARDPFHDCAMREQAALVLSLVEQLSERDRLFVELYFGEGLDPETVAEQMGISVKTVYSKKHKIQHRLMEMLGKKRLAA